MLDKITGTIKVWANKSKNGFIYYHTSIHNKQADGSFSNAMLLIAFHKSVKIPPLDVFYNKPLELVIENAWLTVAKGDQTNTVKLYVKEGKFYDTMPNAPEKHAIDDEDVWEAFRNLGKEEKPPVFEELDEKEVWAELKKL